MAFTPYNQGSFDGTRRPDHEEILSYSPNLPPWEIQQDSKLRLDITVALLSGTLTPEGLFRIMERHDIARILPQKKDPRGMSVEDPVKLVTGAFHTLLTGRTQQELPVDYFGHYGRYAHHRREWLKEEGLWRRLSTAVLGAIRAEGYEISATCSDAVLRGSNRQLKPMRLSSKKDVTLTREIDRIVSMAKRTGANDRLLDRLRQVREIAESYQPFLEVEDGPHDFTVAQFALVKGELEASLGRESRMGRPRADLRNIFNGICYALRTGCAWRDVPKRYGSGSTCHKYLFHWVRDGTFPRVHRKLTKELYKQGRIAPSKIFIDDIRVDVPEGEQEIGFDWGKSENENFSASPT